MWSSQPAVAVNYLKNVTKQYEEHAAKNWTGALRNPDAEPHAVLAALRYVETRRIAGLESGLRELFTSSDPRLVRGDIVAAALDALIATSLDHTETAAFLALVASAEKPLPMSGAAEQALYRLVPEAHEAILSELTQSHSPARLRKLARLLMRMTSPTPPVPIGFWEEADEQDRREAVIRWRKRLAE